LLYVEDIEHTYYWFHRGVIILLSKRGGILIHNEPLEKHQKIHGGALIHTVKNMIILLLKG
jgi:hypothetical protein